ncbi:glycosyltransferase [Bacillaceae bacterium IKA-2]|nr:glycosyltransferase [Bacillaceae bacterium IKA-2]
MKKNLLFVIDSLECAGAEKSLVTLLSMLDYKKYNADLMLFGFGGALEDLLPKEVNLLEPLSYTTYTKLNYIQALQHSFEKMNFKMLASRIKYSLRLRTKNFTNPQKARLFWESSANVIETNQTEYDIAISYAQGIPTFYVAEKVKAKKKFAWVNASLKLEKKEIDFQKSFYDHFNRIVAVSETTKGIFIETFPFYKHKVEVIYDINNPQFISKMASIENGYDDGFKGIKILTIGRLAELKGYDIALEACKILREKGIQFRWYVLGKGPQREKIEKYIEENTMSDYFVLLGVKVNPYPYIKNADIYVQTSRSEGFGLAIAEARMLNIPVVTTRFDSVFNQMMHEKNGLVVDINPIAVANGIIKLIEDVNLKEEIINYLITEKKGNTEELNKVYELIG